ncbi:winged helix-turn-helix domain-containing protein [Anaeromyxobacter diazotrophicus]|uniref:Cytoplasmic protein n=1 Tax=Anaeromyxobacter diazotrophicus TaxID=2590199 RepID=A0A7I9VS30_9BACT|nr:crosslink repair DNA glycosylase YcaQ family protein [Anaeromyxobacter diazotrophicus]GEJ58869.1 hypothetical protein AMYX_36100 [Anaeromyxobacter diazotrophicus]
MAPRPTLTAAQARALHLAAQGLLTPPARAARREDVLAAVRRMALLQLDTIHVVARSHHLVLHARLGEAYRPEWLDELLAEAALFETWAHEACLAPVEEHGLHRRVLATSQHWFVKRARKLLADEREGMAALLEEVRRRGPVKTSDFASARPRHGGWWGWKKEKAWLEAWLALGELMVARRERFQRVYDLAERVLPAAARREPPDEAAARQAVIEQSVRALGVTQARWIHDYFRTRPRLTPEDLRPLVEAGRLLEVRVRGWAAPGFVHRDHAPLLRRAAGGELAATHTALLSPFDPVVWDRERALAMFGFDYRLECYVPARKRRHGYFVLPILRRGALVGRLDAKAHRVRGVFEVKALHLEPGVAAGPALLGDLAAALTASARWHGTPQVRLGRRVAPPLRAALGARLAEVPSPGAGGRERPAKLARPV